MIFGHQDGPPYISWTRNKDDPCSKALGNLGKGRKVLFSLLKFKFNLSEMKLEIFLQQKRVKMYDFYWKLLRMEMLSHTEKNKEEIRYFESQSCILTSCVNLLPY